MKRVTIIAGKNPVQTRGQAIKKAEKALQEVGHLYKNSWPIQIDVKGKKIWTFCFNKADYEALKVND